MMMMMMMTPMFSCQVYQAILASFETLTRHRTSLALSPVIDSHTRLKLVRAVGDSMAPCAS